MALAQAKNPQKRGVTIWVETTARSTGRPPRRDPDHGDGANRNDGKFIDNAKTYHGRGQGPIPLAWSSTAIIPTVTRPAMRSRPGLAALVRSCRSATALRPENIYAHNWIDYKDARYCEGCELASLARKLAYEPGARTW